MDNRVSCTRAACADKHLGSGHASTGVSFNGSLRGFAVQLDERLGNALRRLREQRGWSLTYVAEICGTSAANLSKIERGRGTEYTLTMLSSLARAYGLALHQLFAVVEGVELPTTGMTPEHKYLLEVYDSLKPAQRETLVSIAMTLRPPSRQA